MLNLCPPSKLRNKIFIYSFWELEIFDKNLDEKFSFAPISFELESVFVSEHSKIINKKLAEKSDRGNYSDKKFSFFLRTFFSWNHLQKKNAQKKESACRSIGQGLISSSSKINGKMQSLILSSLQQD